MIHTACSSKFNKYTDLTQFFLITREQRYVVNNGKGKELSRGDKYMHADNNGKGKELSHEDKKYADNNGKIKELSNNADNNARCTDRAQALEINMKIT